MTAEEDAKATEMLHPLEGLEFYLSALKERAKALDPRKRTDMVLCIDSAEKARRLALESLRELLSVSERAEVKRRELALLMAEQARAQGKAEALDFVAKAIAEHRLIADGKATLEPAKAKPKAGRFER